MERAFVVAAFLAAVAFALAHATEAASQPVARDWRASQISRYIVSGTLRKSEGSNTTVKLVHSIVAARTPEEALGYFTRSALESHPDFSLMDTLVTLIPANCGFEAQI